MTTRKLICMTAVLLAFGAMSSGCLKTRAQLKDENANDPADGSSKPIPAKVQDVQPQGGYILDEIRSELTRLQGRVEDIERNQTRGAEDQSRVTKDALQKLENRVIELERAQVQMLEALKKQEEVKREPIELFEAGKDAFKTKEYDDAIDNMTDYLKFPKTKHTEEALFVRAEAYFNTKEYKKAIIDYSKITERYGNSSKVPTSLLKIGQSFEALGMKGDAQGFFQELAERFPKSSEAKKLKAKPAASKKK